MEELSENTSSRYRPSRMFVTERNKEDREINGVARPGCWAAVRCNRGEVSTAEYDSYCKREGGEKDKEIMSGSTFTVKVFIERRQGDRKRWEGNEDGHK